MLKRPSVVVRPLSATMEVESTRVQTMPDGKKMIDVTMRTMTKARPALDSDSEKLVLPQFDEDESDSSSSDEEEGHTNVPQYASPIKRREGGERDEDDDENNNGIEREVRRPSVQGGFQWTGVQDIQTLTHTNAALHGEIAELKTQLKTLQIQLEALAPVPGLNASAVHEILLDKDGTEHDLRDTKIVHQAKTLRHLKRSLQREKQLAVDAIKQLKATELHAATLERENETLKLKLARFQARAAAAGGTVSPSVVSVSSSEDPQAAGETAMTTTTAKERDSLSAYKKKFEDMRIKHDKVLAELKKTQRALLREVGDDVSLDEIVEGSPAGTGTGTENARRGRAQQIIMLKAKVKKLEQDVSKGGVSDSTVSDVDQRAMHDLSVQQNQKQRLNDKLRSERDELLERTQQLSKKFEALKSRTQILEKEKQEHKTKLHVLVEKSRNDDALVDALHKQLESWKNKLHEAKGRARTAESSSLASGGGGSGNGNGNGNGGLPKDDRLELNRLRALVADYKRQQLNPSNGCMPPSSEVAQYRSIMAEKERLLEQVKVLQSQVEERDCQIRGQKTAGDPPAASLPSLGSRIPRLGPGSLPTSQYFPTPPPAETAALETQTKKFREALASKEQAIEALKQQLERFAQQPQQPHMVDETAQQEIRDLQEENEYLRQEFDRLKTRYEAMRKSTSKPI